MSSHKRSSSSTQDDLFNPEVSLLLPPRLAVDGKVLGSPVRQLAVPALRVSCRLQSFSIRRVNGYEATLISGGTLKIISTKTATQLEADLVLLVPGATEPSKIAEALELGEGRWVNIVPANIGALDTRVRGGRWRPSPPLGRRRFTCAKAALPIMASPQSPNCAAPKSAHFMPRLHMRHARPNRRRSSCPRAPARRKPCSRSTPISGSSDCWW